MKKYLFKKNDFTLEISSNDKSKKYSYILKDPNGNTIDSVTGYLSLGLEDLETMFDDISFNQNEVYLSKNPNYDKYPINFNKWILEFKRHIIESIHGL